MATPIPRQWPKFGCGNLGNKREHTQLPFMRHHTPFDVAETTMEPTKATPNPLDAYLNARRFPLLSGEKIKTLARRGLLEPNLLTIAEIQELCGSVIRHIRDEHGVFMS